MWADRDRRLSWVGWNIALFLGLVYLAFTLWLATSAPSLSAALELADYAFVLFVVRLDPLGSGATGGGRLPRGAGLPASGGAPSGCATRGRPRFLPSVRLVHGKLGGPGGGTFWAFGVALAFGVLVTLPPDERCAARTTGWRRLVAR